MIEKVECYQVGQQFFTNFADAQVESILHILGDKAESGIPRDFAETIVANADKVVDVLKPGRELRPRKIRADKGTRRGRKKLTQPNPDTTLKT